MLPASLAYELTALSLGHWYFRRGFHIGYAHMFGQIFPLEELLSMFSIVAGILVIHEVFADDRK